jgi:hypothetical protein
MTIEQHVIDELAPAAKRHYNANPKSHQLYKVIMRSGIAEVLTNVGDEKTKPISMDARSILVNAIESNDVEYAKAVVSKVDGRDIACLMSKAALHGNLEMVKLLRAARHPCHEYDFSMMLRNAYRSRNAEMQNYILQLAKDKCHDSAFKKSFAHGLLMMTINDFKINGGKDPHTFIIYSIAICSADKAIIAAALKFLYDGDVSKISDGAKECILKEACFTNNIEIIKYVMNECKIDPSYFNKIFYEISMTINIETLMFLLNYIDFHVVAGMRTFDIEYAMLLGDLDVVKILIHHLDITKYCGFVNREEIFNEIKDRLKEPERSNTEFRIACKLGRYDDVNRLIDKVDPETVNHSMASACESGCIKTVKRIFWRAYDHHDTGMLIYSILRLGNEEMGQFAIDQIRNQMRYFKHS